MRTWVNLHLCLARLGIGVCVALDRLRCTYECLCEFAEKWPDLGKEVASRGDSTSELPSPTLQVNPTPRAANVASQLTEYRKTQDKQASEAIELAKNEGKLNREAIMNSGKSLGGEDYSFVSSLSLCHVKVCRSFRNCYSATGSFKQENHS